MLRNEVEQLLLAAFGVGCARERHAVGLRPSFVTWPPDANAILRATLGALAAALHLPLDDLGPDHHDLRCFRLSAYTTMSARRQRLLSSTQSTGRGNAGSRLSRLQTLVFPMPSSAATCASSTSRISMGGGEAGSCLTRSLFFVAVICPSASRASWRLRPCRRRGSRAAAPALRRASCAAAPTRASRLPRCAIA